MSQPQQTAPPEARRRLHPLTPLLRGLRYAAIAVVAISWQGYEELGTVRWAMAVVLVAVVLLLAALVSWRATGYHVVGRELRIHEGLLWRRTRAIPLERLQSVELVRPVLARLLGLAELRLEVVGASKTEAPLAYLSLDAALALRERLLALARRAAPVPTGTAPAQPGIAPAQPGTGTEPGAVAAGPVAIGPAPVGALPERRVHLIANRDLFISQLLRPQWWALPLAIAAPIFFFFTESSLSFVAIASTVTAVIGTIQAPVRVLLADWNFTLGVAADGLRIRRGLLETRSQTVPPGRVQAVGIEWPLLWRGHGWVRARMDVAGLTAQDNNRMREGTLLPVGDVPTARRLVGEVLPGFDLTSVAVFPVPRRARWLAPFRAGVLGYTLTDAVFASRDGLLTRRLVVVPYGRIQSIRVVQRPLQRLLRLASVHIDTAGNGLPAIAEHRRVSEILPLITELAERARAARHGG